MPLARATASTSRIASSSRARLDGFDRSSPMVASSAAPSPPKGTTKSIFDQSSAQMSSGTGDTAPEAVTASRSLVTRADGAPGSVDHSSKTSEAGPPAWVM